MWSEVTWGQSIGLWELSMALSSGEIRLGKLGAGKGAPKSNVSKGILFISIFFFFFCPE